MSIADDEEPRQDSLLDWSAPIISDVLLEFYHARFPRNATASAALAKAHFEVWVALLLPQSDRLPMRRALLLEIMDIMHVDSAAAALGDAKVAEELLDIVMRRFRRMPTEARDHHWSLISAVAHLHALTQIEQREQKTVRPASKPTIVRAA